MCTQGFVHLILRELLNAEWMQAFGKFGRVGPNEKVS